MVSCYWSILFRLVVNYDFVRHLKQLDINLMMYSNIKSTDLPLGLV